jgi:hypothetical protein
MTDQITLSREQAREIFKALDGIGALLKNLPSKPDTAPIMYAITGNLAIIQATLAGILRVNPN